MKNFMLSRVSSHCQSVPPNSIVTPTPAMPPQRHQADKPMPMRCFKLWPSSCHAILFNKRSGTRVQLLVSVLSGIIVWLSYWYWNQIWHPTVLRGVLVTGEERKHKVAEMKWRSWYTHPEDWVCSTLRDMFPMAEDDLNWWPRRDAPPYIVHPAAGLFT